MTTITIDSALLEQALEALVLPAHARGFGQLQEAIAALRSALEQPQQKPDIYPDEAYEMGLERIAYYASPPAPRTEPVAWMMVNPTHLPSSRSLHWEPQDWHITWQAVPLYTAPPAPRKPMVGLTNPERAKILANIPAIPFEGDWHTDLFDLVEAKLREKNEAPRKPLTDEELRDVLRECQRDTVENLRVRWLYAKEFARAIEAAHGIKEQT